MANLVFDLGGVVLNWQPLLLLQQVLPHLATDEAQARALSQGLFQSFSMEGDWAAFDRGTADGPTVARRIATRLGVRPDEVQAVIDAIPAHLTPRPDTLALMETLRAEGHRLFYLSNMPTSYAAGLERNEFFKWFDDGVFSCRVQLIKPEPAIYEAAERRFRLPPAELCFIDDVAHNVEAARARGWQGIHFLHAAQCARALSEGLLGR